MKKIIFLFSLLFAAWFSDGQVICPPYSYSIVNNTTLAFAPPAIGGTTVVNYSWDFGDGTSSTTSNPTHTYPNPGTYNACLTMVIIDSGMTLTCVYCDSVSTLVNSGPCMADFTYSIAGPTSIAFMGMGTGPGTITGYSWDFGDGTTSTLQNPNHTYSSMGYYYVCLTISGVDSLNNPFSCDYCDSLYVGNTFNPCMAMYSYTAVASTLSFQDMSVTPGPVTSYSWSFGDGGTSTLQNPSHTYAAMGSYYACLTVAGIDSNNTPFQCSYCDSVFVTNTSSCMASFGFSQPGPNTFSFINTTTVQGTILAYNWDFGDGNTSTLANPSHTYASSGVYAVCLYVTFMDSSSNISYCYYCTNVFVQNSTPCSASFSISQLTGNNFAFTNTSVVSGTITNYLWDFGDGTNSTVQNPSHTYAVTGGYTVCLTIVGIDSNQSTFTCTYCDSIFAQVNSSPCTLNTNFTHGVSALTANFTNTTTCTGCTTMTHTWNFGDGGTSTQLNPTHTYATAGTYTVCLYSTGYATNSSTPCLDTFCTTLTLGPSNVSSTSWNSNLSIYPNPVSNQLNVAIPHTGNFTLKLFDVTGKVIRSENFITTQKLYTLSTQSLSNGVYHILLTDGAQTYRSIMVKE
jgi:PKD repeat protein